jgi:hypothetical protein
MNPESDFLFTGLRAVALKGGEHGPDYDQGVLSVIRQIEQTGSWEGSVMVVFLPVPSPDALRTCFTQEELAEAERMRLALGLTPEQAEQYARGVFAAQHTLQSYKRKNES